MLVSYLLIEAVTSKRYFIYDAIESEKSIEFTNPIHY